MRRIATTRPDGATISRVGTTTVVQTALDSAIRHTYDDLRETARAMLRRERSDIGMDEYELVHETYLRLLSQHRLTWNDKRHFCALATRYMRRILIEHARTRNTAKRGHGQYNLPLDAAENVSANAEAPDFEINDILQILSKKDKRQAKILEYKMLHNLQTSQIADILRISPCTVYRAWKELKVEVMGMLNSGTVSQAC